MFADTHSLSLFLRFSSSNSFENWSIASLSFSDIGLMSAFVFEPYLISIAEHANSL